jgi:ribosomal protein L11 methyltransferase
MTGIGWDIDPLAIANAQENKLLNDVGDFFEACRGSIQDAGERQYDLVIANILAAPLTDMAPQIMAAVKPGGSLILSGFLTVQTPGLEAAYQSMGPGERLSEPSVAIKQDGQGGSMPIDDWVCLFWPCKPQ